MYTKDPDCNSMTKDSEQDQQGRKRVLRQSHNFGKTWKNLSYKDEKSPEMRTSITPKRKSFQKSSNGKIRQSNKAIFIVILCTLLSLAIIGIILNRTVEISFENSGIKVNFRIHEKGANERKDFKH